MVTIKWPVWRASASAEFVRETLIYSNQRESILLTLLVLRCFLAPPLRGGALISVSLEKPGLTKRKGKPKIKSDKNGAIAAPIQQVFQV